MEGITIYRPQAACWITVIHHCPARLLNTKSRSRWDVSVSPHMIPLQLCMGCERTAICHADQESHRSGEKREKTAQEKPEIESERGGQS